MEKLLIQDILNSKKAK